MEVWGSASWPMRRFSWRIHWVALLKQGGWMSDVLSFVEIDGLQAELLPARTVLTAGYLSYFGGGWEYFDFKGGPGGHGGDGGNGNTAGDGYGGDGGVAIAVVSNNENHGGEQYNTAYASADGGDGYGGNVDADGGNGGHGGDGLHHSKTH
jgi:hypothetical protein